MTDNESHRLLAQLGSRVADQLGLHFPPERAADLRKKVRQAAREFGFEDADECIRWLLSARLTREQVEILASNLTVGETYFFREKRVFELLEEQLLPEWIRSRRGGERRIRIWSAGCCTGEEPYSIAISVRKVLGDLKDWRVTILATDINPHFLRKAERGVFGGWSFRGTHPGLREVWFTKSERDRWEIRPEIRDMVQFLHLNLAEDSYPSLLNSTTAMDLVLCRNVLIYFAPEKTRGVIRNLADCLTEGGWLALGPNELSHASLPSLAAFRFPGATLHRRDSSRSLAPPIAPERPPRETFTFPPPPPLGEPKFDVDRAWAPSAPPPPGPGSDHWSARNPEIEPPQRSAYERALELYDRHLYAEAVEALSAPCLRMAGRLEVPGEPGEPDVSDVPDVPGEASALLLMAQAVANRGELAEALAWSDRGIRVDKMNPRAHYLRASILREQGDLDGAKTSFNRALYLDPQFTLVHFALGNLARGQGKPVEADRHFENALELALQCRPEEALPEADGLTAGRLVEIINGLRGAGTTVMAWGSPGH